MQGPSNASAPIFLSATRFTYRKLWDMPLVSWHGFRLRSAWGQVEGAVGMFTAASFLDRTTYTLSVWKSAADFMAWVRSPHHAHLMSGYKDRLESWSSVTWSADTFRRSDAWEQALSRLDASEAKAPGVTRP
jgi:hypothetical protein